jgi:N-acetylmuramoyl-L-alanine amidase
LQERNFTAPPKRNGITTTGSNAPINTRWSTSAIRKAIPRPKALYQAGDLYTRLYKYSHKTKDLDAAIGLYEKLVAEHEDHFLADDAQYKIGEIYYTIKNDPSQAYVEFLKVDVRFPEGRYAAQSQEDARQAGGYPEPENEPEKWRQGPAPENHRAMVKNIRYWSTPNYTRVVIDVKAPVKYEHHLLKADPSHKKPRRLYLDLHKARVSRRINSVVTIGDDLLQKARAGQYTEGHGPRCSGYGKTGGLQCISSL